MDQSDGEPEVALQLSEKAEEPGDVSRAVFVHAVETALLTIAAWRTASSW